MTYIMAQLLHALTMLSFSNANSQESNVDHSEQQSYHMPFLMKALIMGVIGIFLIIGLAGLILPIIPGILFLSMAAVLLSKISSRFAFYLQHNTTWIKWRRYWRSIGFLSFAQQLKLSLLVLARSLLNAIDSSVKFFSKK